MKITTIDFSRYTESYWNKNHDQRKAIVQEHVERMEQGVDIWNKADKEFAKYVEENEISDPIYYFDEAEINHPINFRRSTFSCMVSFYVTTFNERVVFSESRFNMGADFAAATFSSEADFSNAIFDENVNFSVVTFNGYTTFWSAKFRKSVDFLGSHFEAKVDLSGVNFSGDVIFKQVLFEGEVRFDGAGSCSVATFCENVNFSSTYFSESAIFNGAEFKKKVNFEWAKFKGSVECEQVKFSGYVNFRKVLFMDWVRFSRATFESDVDFTETTFDNNIDFKGVVFNGDVVFKKAIFKGKVEFKKAGFKKTASFILAESEKSIPDFTQVDSVQVPLLEGLLIPWDGSDPQNNITFYRELKKLAIEAADHEQELQNFAYEMRCKGRLTKNFFIKILIGLYYWFSNIGQSFLRPIIGLTILWLVTFVGDVLLSISPSKAEFFSFLDAPCQIRPLVIKSKGEAIFSQANRIIFPIIPIDRITHKEVRQCLYGGSGAVPYLHRMFHGLTQTGSLVFWFLLGLAIRNRFKMK